jgi:biotin carboxyl carrier protein
VKQGDTLLEVQGSPASLLQLHQAEATAEKAHKELDQAKKRFEMKLATNQELNQAQKAASDAELQLESLKTQSVAADNKIRSDITGIVAKVDVEDGQVASAGSPLVDFGITIDLPIFDRIQGNIAIETATRQKLLDERRPSAQTIIIGGGQLLEPRQDFGIVFPAAGQFLNGSTAAQIHHHQRWPAARSS